MKDDRPICSTCRKRACESRGLVNGRRLHRTRCEVCRKAAPYPSGRASLVVELARMPDERFERLLAAVLARRTAQRPQALSNTTRGAGDGSRARGEQRGPDRRFVA